MALKTPVLLTIFNRPKLTKRVFEQIRKIQPEKLYIAADGPRENYPDKENCRAARAVVEKIDWPCKVKTLFREKNLGCGLAMSGAINWFFNDVDEGIILEDDCLPNKNFFYFCEKMLAKYRSHPHIMHISGSRFFEPPSKDHSYYFSNFPIVWGWATWRRAWDSFDFEMKQLKNFFLMSTPNLSFNQKIILEYLFQTTAQKKVDTWDYQWWYSILTKNGLSIQPTKNMVKNIGVDNSTHVSINDRRLNYPYSQKIAKIVHPKKMKISTQNDRYYFRKFYTEKGLTIPRVLASKFKLSLEKWFDVL